MPNDNLEQLTAKERLTLEDCERYAKFMDASVPLPGGFKVGLDGIIGLIPGIGDGVGFVAALYPVYLARKVKAPLFLQMRMLFNAGIEALIGSIPIIGDLFDFVFKANLKNAQLLKNHLSKLGV